MNSCIIKKKYSNYLYNLQFPRFFYQYDTNKFTKNIMILQINIM